MKDEIQHRKTQIKYEDLGSCRGTTGELAPLSSVQPRVSSCVLVSISVVFRELQGRKCRHKDISIYLNVHI